jgi:hypothetical protein
MHFKHFSAFCLVLLLAQLGIAQQQKPHFCGTTGKTKWLIDYQKNRQINGSVESADTNWLYVPVTFHILGTDQGTGYFLKSRIFKALCNMNSQFEPSYIKFYLHPTLPFNYINNSDWNEHDWTDGEDMITATNIDDRLNAYMVKDPAGNCGYSWLDAIVLSNSCSGEDNSTWAHEAGHHFSLPHPFVGWEGRNVNPLKPAPATLGWGEVEKVDRSNCMDAADGFCDTEPDYISNRWNCDANGQSFQMLDPDSVAFKADGTYIMGYANDACATRFMPDQIAAMRANIQDQFAQYLVETQHGPMLADNSATVLLSPIDTMQMQYNNATFSWTPMPGAEHYQIEIGLYGSFNPLIHTNTVSGATSYTYQGGLPKNRNLYWRVKAFSAWDICEEQNSYQIGVFKSLDVSAVNELEADYTVTIVPNPVSAGLPAVVTLDADRNESLQANLVDMTGRTIWTKQTKVFAGAQTLDLPTESLASGQYRLTLRNERGIISRVITVFE